MLMSVIYNPLARAACLAKVFARKGVIAFVFSVGAFGFTSAARAGLTLSISVNGGAPTVVNDNGAGDANPAPNSITYNSTIIGFALSLISANTNDPGNSSSGFISSTEILLDNTGNSPITVSVSPSDTGFTGPAGGRRLESDISATLNGLGAGDFASLTSTANATSTPTQTVLASGSNSKIIPFADAGTYSLNNVSTIRLSPGATAAITSTTSVISVPEPTSIGLLVLGALGLLARRRRA
jgi:PEP-CTERM motif